MAEISLSLGLPVIPGECSKLHSKCAYFDLERAVAHTSTNSSREVTCTINFIAPLLIKTDTVSFSKTVWCQCRMEILLIGKFIRINTCRERKPGTKFFWCLEGRRLLWALGVVVLSGGGCLVVICSFVIGVFLSVWTYTCWSGVTYSVFAGAIILPKNKVFMLQVT